MKWINLVFVLVILIYSVNVFGQNTKTIKVCQEEALGKSFISDGQDHQALLKSNKPSKFNVVFYPKFRYKLVVCSNNKQMPLDIRVIDTNGVVYFSNADKHYVRQWEFQYSSIMNAIIEVRSTDSTIKEEGMRLLIGYQPL